MKKNVKPKTMLDYALEYARAGMSVVPTHSVDAQGRCSCSNRNCASPGKHPRLRWKSHSIEPLTEDKIISWWTKFPEANIGIITGVQSGVTVLDIDGPQGLESLKEAGFPIEELPESPMVLTGGGGIHIYYRFPEKIKVKTGSGILPKVDIRSEGGFVVVPPSTHKSGKRYEWAEGKGLFDIPLADFDWSFVTETKPVERKIKLPNEKRWYEECLKGVESGGRNDACARLAGRYFGLGLTQFEVERILIGWNLYNDPPMDEEEMIITIRSIMTAEDVNSVTTREDRIENINNILGMELFSISRITGDEPKYIMDFDKGKCIISASQLLSPKLFQQAILESTNIVVKKLTAKTVPTHDQLVQMITSLSEDIYAGEEATEAGEMKFLINDFLSSQSQVLEIEPGIHVPSQGCFIQNDKIWISLDDLVHRNAVKWGGRLNRKQCAQKLKALNLERKVFYIGSTSRILWGADVSEYGGGLEPNEEDEEI